MAKEMRTNEGKASKLTKNGRSQIMQQIQINASMPLVCGATDTDHDSYPTDHSNFFLKRHRYGYRSNPSMHPKNAFSAKVPHFV